MFQKTRWGKYPIEAIIFEKRGDNLVKTNDRVGKINDPYSDMVYYKLKKSGDTIPVYNFDWVMHNNIAPMNILERYINMLQGNSGTIFLFRYGSKQYKPINMNSGANNKKKLTEIVDKTGKPIFVNQYVQFDPRKELGILEFEVIDWDNMNFMVQEQRATIVRRQKKGEFWKQTLLPLAALAAVAMVSIFMLKFSADAGANLSGTPPAAPEPSIIGGAIDGAISPGE
tara:strand:+ start:5820 stop:6500 length:681 start_codon:yes stop_codon:yes gene_type:complete